MPGSDRSACPVCGEARGDPTGLYRHLQVGHRKSAVAEALIDATRDWTDPTDDEATVTR